MICLFLLARVMVDPMYDVLGEGAKVRKAIPLTSGVKTMVTVQKSGNRPKS